MVAPAMAVGVSQDKGLLDLIYYDLKACIK